MYCEKDDEKDNTTSSDASQNGIGHPWLVPVEKYNGKLDDAWEYYKDQGKAYAVAKAKYEFARDDQVSLQKTIEELEKSKDDDVKFELLHGEIKTCAPSSDYKEDPPSCDDDNNGDDGKPKSDY